MRPGENAVAGPAGQFGCGRYSRLARTNSTGPPKSRAVSFRRAFFLQGFGLLVRIFLRAALQDTQLHPRRRGPLWRPPSFSGNGLQLIEMGPLCRDRWHKFSSTKTGVAPLAGLSLQRQGDENSKPPGGQVYPGLETYVRRNQRLRRLQRSMAADSNPLPSFLAMAQGTGRSKTATGGPLHRSGAIPRRRAAMRLSHTVSVPPTRSPTPSRQNPAQQAAGLVRAHGILVPPPPGQWILPTQWR
jgi:hypothetical protein